MSLTGTGIQIGSAVQFGVGQRFPRGLASDGTTLYMFSSSIAYILGDTTGIATQIGSDGLGAGVNQIRAATYHDGNIIVWANSEKRFYTVSSAGIATEIGGQFTSSWDFWAIASLGGVLYAIDRARDSLYVINLTNAAATRVGTADEFDVGSGNVQSLTAYRDELIAISTDLEKILRINATDGTAEIVANDSTLPDVSPEAAAEHNGNLLMLGSSADALFRLYDVLWDETIDDLEVDAGSGETWDLSAISQDAASLSLQGSPPSWLSVSGTDLVATSAPDVDSDQNNDVTVRATRDGVNVDKTLRVVVKNTGTPPPTNTAPEFANATYTFNDIAIAVNTVVGTVAATDADNDTLTYSLTGTDNANFAIDSDGEITVAEALNKGETYEFSVEVDDGTDTDTADVTVNTETTIANAPTVDSITPDATSADVVLTAPTDDGGADITRYEARYGEGSSVPSSATWKNVGTSTSFTISSLEKGTEYAAEFRAVNSEGNGTATAIQSFTTNTTATSAIPEWQTGSALESSIDALESTTIDIAAKVSGEDEIEIRGGFNDAWMDFDGTELEITEAPIYREDTVIRLKFRAKSDDGFADAVYLLTVNGSRLIWRHSTLICKPAINYDGDRVTVRGASTVVSEMTDNSYLTHSTETDVDIDVSDGTNATKIDAIFLKTKNVDSYSFTPSGGAGDAFTDRDIPSTYETVDGRDQSAVVNGFQHEIYLLDAEVTATSVRLQFTGTGIEIYAVMLLELLAEIRDGEFLDVLPDKVDRTGRVQSFPDGSVDRVSPLGAARWKWETQCLLKIGSRNTTYATPYEFLALKAANPEIVFIPEAGRYPERAYPAEWGLDVSIRLRGQSKSGGYVARFQILEA